MERAASDTDLFQNFKGRDRDLRALTRYDAYKVMLYRTNLYTHAHRTAALVRAINPWAISAFGAAYDPVKAELIALVHDDAELVFGDIQAGNKSKMMPKQLAEVREAEQRAIDEIAQRFPEYVGDYSYRELLQEAASYSSLEAQVVCYADKYDALGEALHEIYAGNYYFTTNIINEYGRIPTPPEYYAAYFANFADKFPKMQPLLGVPSAIFEPVVNRDYSLVAAKGSPHTKASLQVPTGSPHYDTWRKIILNDTNSEVLQDLYAQKEFIG